ncbi:MAG: hypothetical protein AVDCRST_MAG07-3329, partial [uncultured Frankineae bacterium]
GGALVRPGSGGRDAPPYGRVPGAVPRRPPVGPTRGPGLPGPGM